MSKKLTAFLQLRTLLILRVNENFTMGKLNKDL